MKNKLTNQSVPARQPARENFRSSLGEGGFFRPRVLLYLLVYSVAGCFVASDGLLAFFRTDAPPNHAERTIKVVERVAYQRAIEEVYWHHRIWPNSNASAKPPLDKVMSQAEIEKKVENYLRNSQALEGYWQRPIKAEQLQAEMDRMAKYTKQPAVLRELFDALGNDPFVIAECLARPALAGRLVTDLYTHEQRIHGEAKVEYRRASADNRAPYHMAAASASYRLPTISGGPSGCSVQTWTTTSTVNAPAPRASHTAVWTGSEMIVWGGYGGTYLNTGGRYDPSTNSWTAISTINAPAPRGGSTAVWTGTEMIVWGGDDGVSVNTGGKYNPATDTWTATNTATAPLGRIFHTAVWDGSEMIVWGGWNEFELQSGGRYNPGTDSWAATSVTSAPSARFDHAAVWTGSEMIVWGGWNGSNSFNTGGRYNPGTDGWTAISTTNAPAARYDHTGVWTGNEMIVWGGRNAGNYFNTGGKYNPNTDNWAATSTTNAPGVRFSHTAVWTGSDMIVWGGTNMQEQFNTGGRYNPGTDNWMATTTSNAPERRAYHTAVWSGSEMIVWGGLNDFGPFFLNTGGKYCAQTAPAISINPSKDNTLYQYVPADGDRSNALGFHLFAGKTAMGELRRGMLAFDIAGSIPAGSTITGVTLSMNMSRTPISVAYPVELHKLLADWGQGTSQASGEEGEGAPATPNDATWRHRFFDTIFWAAQGGDFSATVSASQSVSVVGLYTWSSPQMVADVQDWLDNPVGNFGWLVLGDEKPTMTAKRFDTRESASPPVLTIEYTAGPTPTPTPAESCLVVQVSSCNSVVHTPPTDFIAEMSCPVDQVQPSGFRVNNIGANSFIVSKSTITFHFNTSPAVPGLNTIHILNDAITCCIRPVNEFTCTFTYVADTPTPTPTATSTPTPSPRGTPVARPRPAPHPRP